MLLIWPGNALSPGIADKLRRIDGLYFSLVVRVDFGGLSQYSLRVLGGDAFAAPQVRSKRLLN